MSDQRSFSDLEHAVGQVYLPGTGEKWPLQEWYDFVRQTPMSQLSPGDLAKACRQHIWIDQVVPIAVAMLQHDPLAGELYDGELLRALNSIPTLYWSQHHDVAKRLCEILETQWSEFDDEVQAGARELLSSLESYKRE